MAKAYSVSCPSLALRSPKQDGAAIQWEGSIDQAGGISVTAGCDMIPPIHLQRYLFDVDVPNVRSTKNHQIVGTRHTIGCLLLTER